MPIKCKISSAAVGTLLALVSINAVSQERLPSEQDKATPPTVSASKALWNAHILNKGAAPAQMRDPSFGQKTSSARGNPLWSIPVTSLNASRERPIFSESRRPPAPAATPAAQASQPVQLSLALVGAIASETQSVAIFVDSKTKGVVRLKPGESHFGWVLREVNARTVTMQRGSTSTTLTISNAASN